MSESNNTSDATAETDFPEDAVTIEDADQGAAHSMTLYVEERLPHARSDFEDEADEYGLPHALDWQLEGVRKAQGFDDYTRTCRRTVKDFMDGEATIRAVIEETKEAIQTLEQDAVRNYPKRDVHNGAEAYRTGRAKAHRELDRLLYEAEKILNDCTGEGAEPTGARLA